MNIYKLTKIQLYKWFNRTLQLQISSWRIIIKTKYSLDPLNVLRQSLFMKYDKLHTHCCAFINYSIFFAKITQFAWAISKNVREIRSSAWNYYTSEAHLELDTRAVRYIRWEKSSREERQERIKPVLDLETQLIVSILSILLHCIANHDLIAQSNKYLHLNAKVVIAVVELMDLMRYALSLSICFIYLLIVWEC